MVVQLRGIAILSSIVGLVVSQCQQNSFKSDAGDKIEAVFKRDHKRGVDYSKIEVEWQPILMVEDPNCINQEQLYLEMNHDGGEAEWTKVGGLMRVSGPQGKFKWTLDVAPCKDHYFRVWVDGEGGRAYFLLPNPVKAVSEDILKESKYKVVPPQILSVTVLSGSEVNISFTESECALEYEISYNKDGSNESKSQKISNNDGYSFTLTEGIEACTDYNFQIFAYIGEKIISEETSGFFTTAPNENSVNKLEPNIVQSLDSLTVWWNSADCPCITEYEVSVCKANQQDCEPVEISSNKLPKITHTVASLDQCTAYTITIKPIYQVFDLDEKIIETKTISPSLTDVLDQLVVNSGEGGQGVEVLWSSVECATSYKVYQMPVNGNNKWQEVATTQETSWTGVGVPCTEYYYGVSVVMDHHTSDIKTVGEPIITTLNDAAVFEPPNLHIIPKEDEVVFTFDHGSCISSYKMMLCSLEDVEMCFNRTYTPSAAGQQNITYSTTGLDPCTNYTVRINPTYNGTEIQSGDKVFTTTSPQPTPPEEANITLSADFLFVELSWSKVICASGYKILQRIQDNDSEMEWDVQDESMKIDKLVPCTHYKYGIAAVVGGDDSEPTEWQDITAPPRGGQGNNPTIGHISRDNHTISFQLIPYGDNTNCKIESYKIQYHNGNGTEDLTFSTDNLTSPTILLKSLSMETQIYTQIKYQGFQSLSEWVPIKVPHNVKGEVPLVQPDKLVAIILGSLLPATVIIVTIYCILKRRKSNQKYQVEMSNGAIEETEKLNGQVVQQLKEKQLGLL